MELVKIYKKPFGYLGTWTWETDKAHIKLLEENWSVIKVEDAKEWDISKTCLLGCLFLPLALLGKTEAYKVTYKK